MKHPVDVLLLGSRLGFVILLDNKRLPVRTKPQKSRKTDGILTIRFAGAAHLQANETAPFFFLSAPEPGAYVRSIFLFLTSSFLIFGRSSVRMPFSSLPEIFSASMPSRSKLLTYVPYLRSLRM